MIEAKLVLTSISTNPPLVLKSSTALTDPTKYHAIVDNLQYLLIIRFDLAFVVNKLSQYIHTLTTKHWTFVKRLLRYLCGTINEGLQIHRQSPMQLHALSNHTHRGFQQDLQAFSDADCLFRCKLWRRQG